MTALFDAALGYAARGIPVYPVHWPRPIPDQASVCSCRRGPGCDRPAKHPLVRHGLYDATCDPGQLQDWWQRWPLANVGLATGICFDALDIDGPDGLAVLRELQQAAGLRLPGPPVATGGDGWHVWFTPTGLGNRPPHGLAHVDWRGRGGCVLAPPQPPHLRPPLPLAGRPRSGAPGRGPGRPPPPARPRPADHRPASWYGRAGPGRPPVRPPGPGRRAGRPRPGHPGQRNRTLNRTAFKVYRYVAGGVLDDQDVTVAFTSVARAIGLTAAETARTLASARTAGLANPRAVPAPPDASRYEVGP